MPQQKTMKYEDWKPTKIESDSINFLTYLEREMEHARDTKNYHPRMQRIRENRKKLDSCDRHEFEVTERYPSTLPKTSTCKKCGGYTDSLSTLWYEEGLEHGRRASE